MNSATTEQQQTRLKVEDRLDKAPRYMREQVFGVIEDKYDHYVIRRGGDGRDEPFRLQTKTASDLSRGIDAAPAGFSRALLSLRDELDNVLVHGGDAAALEHHAVLFWPSLSRLRPFLGMDPRQDELITHFDMLRAQFRLQPVTETVLRAFRDVLHTASMAPVLSAGVVDECLDVLEDSGADLRYPLSFSCGDED